MYRMTPLMLQNLGRELRKFHDQFIGGRCAGWQMEELLVRAIQSDTSRNHHVEWREHGHDDKADIRVRANGREYPIEVKSGQVKKKTGKLTLSGHRLGRFQGDFGKITDYLNGKMAHVISLAHEKHEDEQGRHHIYRLYYIEPTRLRGLAEKNWDKVGAQFKQTNSDGVEFSLRPSMSWQIWWTIPVGQPEKIFDFA